MKQVMILVLVAALCVMSPASYVQDNSAEDNEIVIVKAPEKNRNPYQEEYERMLYPCVRITAGWSTGSGVIFSTTDKPQMAQIITAAHVVGNQNAVDIELYNLETIVGTVVITDTIKDIALIKAEINTDKIYTAKLASKDYTPYIFAPVYTVGCSLGLEPRPSQGILSVIGKYNWEVTSPVLPGNSGGPVYDAKTYEVIGIAVWVKVCQGQLVTTMAGIVPITEIYEFLDSHRDTEVTEK